MRFVAVLNRSGGSFTTIDLEAFGARMREILQAAGHSLEIRICEGKGVVDALQEAARDHGYDVVLAGGGDGTISAAAGALWKSGKTLAVLPAGTMNLFARSLGIPLDLEAAVAALATGRIHMIDVASANGRPFVHQYSIGMHPQVLRLRSRISYRSRLGKMLASGRAMITTFLRPPRLRVALTMRSKELFVATSGISITNNPYGEGHLPYADMPDRGVLGIYVTRARRRRDLLLFVLNVAIGRWHRNEQVDIHYSDEVRLAIRSPARRFQCAIDGELCELENETTIRIHPATLGVLVPADGSGERT